MAPADEGGELQKQGGWEDLSFSLVEIVGLEEPVDPLPEVLEANPRAKKLEVNGKKGQTVAWLEEEGKYLVETFDGDFAPIAEGNLREYEPLSPEHGGFDLAMPRSGHRGEFFPAELAELLGERHWCVLQATSTPEDRKLASRSLLEREDKWARIMPEVEAFYMGRNPRGKKVLWLSHDTEDDADDEGKDDGLIAADRTLTTLSAFLGPMCPTLGFEGHHRTNGIVHTRCVSPEEEEELLQVFSDETSAVSSEEVQTHISFVHRRKICMMYFVLGSGGTLILHPANKEADDIYISCKENQIVVFRHDLCDYTFEPDANQICVQAWILREAHAGEVGIRVADVERRLFREDYVDVPEGPTYGNSDETVDCMSLACHFACSTDQPEDYWAMLSAGCDGGIKIPLQRWDHDVYFEPEADLKPGKCYSQHFGFINLEVLQLFNNDFFGISAEDSKCIDPPARVLLEVGYECLHRAGWDKAKLNGVTMGVSLGAQESEWAGFSVQGMYGVAKQTRTELLPGMIAARHQYVFGMKGPCVTCDTACSSALSATCVMHHWMRPMMPDQRMARTMMQQVPYGLAGGANCAFGPGTIMGFCGAHMLSIQGRCFTFDQTADGFLRAEGIGAMHYKTSHAEDHARLSMLVASTMNQDGRSASLTAPHGPSQQECIRISLREAQASPFDVQVQELHGTGTSLGDPIETGSLRATMMAVAGEVRTHPIVKTSSKSNFGHTELNAGICGIMKCCLICTYVCAAPNVNLRLLNPHIDDNGYPVIFSTELVDQCKSTGYCGVSSFGWSGCNARGDMWGRALAGPRNTEPGGRVLDLTDVRIFRTAAINRISAPPPERPQAGAALDDLEAYKGDYMVGALLDEKNTFYCRGSFSGWASMERMQWFDDKNAYAFAFALGETRVEQFQIVVNKSEYYTIFPATMMADAFAPIFGPGTAPPSHNWLVDGRRQGAAQGTVFLVLFTWDEAARQKRIWWEPTSDERALAIAAGVTFRHSYCLVASWNVWKPVKMRAGTKDGEPGFFEAEIRIGLDREESFHFLRDADPNQAIYPARGKAKETNDMPVRGPDHRGEGKHWQVVGRMGEAVTVQLRVWEGEITVSTSSTARGLCTWTSNPGRAPTVYYVSATWNEYGFSPMTPDPGGNKHVFRLRKTLTRERIEAFQIVVDKDFGQVIHPEMQLADQLVSQAFGPDAKGEDLHWGFYGTPSTVIEITLDLSQMDVDRHKVVTWTMAALKEEKIIRHGLDAPPDAPEWPLYEYEAEPA